MAERFKCGCEPVLAQLQGEETLKKLREQFGAELTGAVLLFSKACVTAPNEVHYAAAQMTLLASYVQKDEETAFDWWVRKTIGLETLQSLQEDQKRARERENLPPMYRQAPTKDKN